MVTENVETPPVERTGNPVPMRTPAHGFGKLKVGGIHEHSGRPKQDVRARICKRADELSVGWAERILKDPQIPENDPAKGKAAELLLRYGLGTKDEVQIQQKDAVLQALAQVSAQEGWTPDQAARILARLAEALGIE